MKYLQYFLILFLVADYRLAHFDELYKNESSYRQFFIYDLCQFLRIGLLISQVIFFMVCSMYKNYIKLNWIMVIFYLLYWSFQLYEFKLWLDIQHSLSGQAG